MILNGLGMVSKPLYMFPKFFGSIACEHLIGAGVKPEYLKITALTIKYFYRPSTRV
jgi:hypothetical protein